jgi:inner membrane protein
MSLILLPFPYTDNNLIIIAMSAALSALPDLDLKWQRQGINIRHRGPTHSILFAVIAGIAFGGMFWYANKTLTWAGMGFLSGFMGVVSHLIGDMFTHHAFKPLWPLSSRETALHLTRASNKAANDGLATAGGAAFMLYVLNGHGILADLLITFL